MTLRELHIRFLLPSSDSTYPLDVGIPGLDDISLTMLLVSLLLVWPSSVVNLTRLVTGSRLLCRYSLHSQTVDNKRMAAAREPDGFRYLNLNGAPSFRQSSTNKTHSRAIKMLANQTQSPDKQDARYQNRKTNRTTACQCRCPSTKRNNIKRQLPRRPTPNIFSLASHLDASKNKKEKKKKNTSPVGKRGALLQV